MFIIKAVIILQKLEVISLHRGITSTFAFAQALGLSTDYRAIKPFCFVEREEILVIDNGLDIQEMLQSVHHRNRVMNKGFAVDDV